MTEASKTVVVVGQGYVGLPLAMRAVEVGYRVVGYETNADRVERLMAADPYVEGIVAETLASAIKNGRYRATTEEAHCSGFDYALITVPTPLTDGVPDVSNIVAAGRSLAPHLRPGACVVLESTTYPGTTAELLAPLLESGSGLTAGIDFHVGFSPERIDPGNPVWGIVNTPKIVSGLTPTCLKMVKAFYDTIVAETVVISRPHEAELAKLIENTFRHVNIALVNELAMSAHDLELDIWEAIAAASTKPFGFMRFQPGPGVGGHCLPVDPSYLSWHLKRRSGSPFRFVELANDINDHMPEYVVHRVTLGLNRRSKTVMGSRILIVGLAYKPDTGDLREAPALGIAGRLLELGADVRAADPLVERHACDPRIERVELTAPEVTRADAIVLTTDHSVFDLGLIENHASYVLDTRHRLRGCHVEYL